MNLVFIKNFLWKGNRPMEPSILVYGKGSTSVLVRLLGSDLDMGSCLDLGLGKRVSRSRSCVEGTNPAQLISREDNRSDTLKSRYVRKINSAIDSDCLLVLINNYPTVPQGWFCGLLEAIKKSSRLVFTLISSSPRSTIARNNRSQFVTPRIESVSDFALNIGHNEDTDPLIRLARNLMQRFNRSKDVTNLLETLVGLNQQQKQNLIRTVLS